MTNTPVFKILVENAKVTGVLDADGKSTPANVVIASKAARETFKEEYADKLVGYAERYIPGLREHIHACEIITPEDWRARTHTSHHAFGGLAPIMGKTGISHKTPISGLWFVGAQSQSGGGVSGVLLGAYKTAKRVASGT